MSVLFCSLLLMMTTMWNPPKSLWAGPSTLDLQIPPLRPKTCTEAKICKQYHAVHIHIVANTTRYPVLLLAFKPINLSKGNHEAQCRRECTVSSRSPGLQNVQAILMNCSLPQSVRNVRVDNSSSLCRSRLPPEKYLFHDATA